MRPRRPPLTRRVTVARRLAAGLAPAEAARAARCPPELLDRLLAEDEFHEIVQGWRALLGLDPDARTARLIKLAQLVLEEALERRSIPAALFTLAHAVRGQDPVLAVVDGLERGLQRAREEAARAAAPSPAPAPARLPDAPRTTDARPAGTRPDPLDALCHRTAAALRAAAVVEQGRWAGAAPLAPSPAGDPGADPLGAAVHGLHRSAAAHHAAPPLADPRRAQQIDALTEQLLGQLARAGPQERLALERLDDAALDRLARQLLPTPPRAGSAQPQGP